MVSQDYEDLFNTLNARGIKYLVVGAHAVAFYAEPRFTKDLDVWIPPALNDPARVYAALKEFGAPMAGVSPADFQDPSVILQIGVPPVRVDIIMDLAGLPAARAWRRRKRGRFGGAPVNVLGLADLVAAKRAAGRPQDLLDLGRLKGVAAAGRRRARSTRPGGPRRLGGARRRAAR